MRTAYLSFSVLLALGTLQRAHAANLLLDGGFESPKVRDGGFQSYLPGKSIGAWLVVGPGDVAVTSTDYQSRGITFNAHKGKAYLDLTGLCDCGDASGVSQTVATSQGATYRLSFWVGNTKISRVGKTSLVNVYNGTTLLISAENRRGAGETDQVWKHFSVDFVAANSSTTLSFLNGDGNHDINNGLDSVKLEQQP